MAKTILRLTEEAFQDAESKLMRAQSVLVALRQMAELEYAESFSFDPKAAGTLATMGYELLSGARDALQSTTPLNVEYSAEASHG